VQSRGNLTATPRDLALASLVTNGSAVPRSRVTAAFGRAAGPEHPGIRLCLLRMN
jgi:hypothetical protein